MPLISKIFEKVLYYQIEEFANKILSPKLCIFRKGHSTRHALLNLLKKWQKCLDKSGVVGTVLWKMEDANFEGLLIKDSSWTIHENNIHTLLIEIYLVLP